MSSEKCVDFGSLGSAANSGLTSGLLEEQRTSLLLDQQGTVC